jgi:hypothetical protein
LARDVIECLTYPLADPLALAAPRKGLEQPAPGVIGKGFRPTRVDPHHRD